MAPPLPGRGGECHPRGVEVAKLPGNARLRAPKLPLASSAARRSYESARGRGKRTRYSPWMEHPLRTPAFRRLATAYTVNEFGNWLGDVALAIVVFDRTGSALATAALFLSSRVV